MCPKLQFLWSNDEHTTQTRGRTKHKICIWEDKTTFDFEESCCWDRGQQKAEKGHTNGYGLITMQIFVKRYWILNISSTRSIPLVSHVWCRPLYSLRWNWTGIWANEVLLNVINEWVRRSTIFLFSSWCIKKFLCFYIMQRFFFFDVNPKFETKLAYKY